MVNEDGQQHLNTRLSRDAQLPRTDNYPWLHDVFTAPRVFISGAVTGPVVTTPFVAISRVAEAGGNRAVRTSGSLHRPSQLFCYTRHFRAAGTGRRRSQLRILARTQNPGLIGTPMTMTPAPPSGFARAVTHEKDPVYLAWTTSSLSGWSTGVAAPANVIDNPAYQGTLNAVGLSAIALVLAIGAGLYFGRRLTLPIDQLVHEVRSGLAPAQSPRSAIVEINVLGAAFRGKVKALLEALSARDAAQLELKQLNEELEARVRVRSAELELLNETLIQTQKQELLGRRPAGLRTISTIS